MLGSVSFTSTASSRGDEEQGRGSSSAKQTTKPSPQFSTSRVLSFNPRVGTPGGTVTLAPVCSHCRACCHCDPTELDIKFLLALMTALGPVSSQHQSQTRPRPGMLIICISIIMSYCIERSFHLTSSTCHGACQNYQSKAPTF